MHFEYTGSDEGIRQAVEYCEKLHGRQDFWDRVVANDPYDFSDLPAEEIASYMRGYNGVVRFKFFTGRWRFRNTVAYVSQNTEDIIFLNTRFLGNSVARKVNTLVHEFVHITDYFGDSDRSIEYGHGSQSSEGKGKSAPYAIGKIAEETYKADNPTFIKQFMVEPLNFECDLGDLPESMIMSDI